MQIGDSVVFNFSKATGKFRSIGTIIKYALKEKFDNHPFAFDGGWRDAENLAGFFDCQSAEKPQFKNSRPSASIFTEPCGALSKIKRFKRFSSKASTARSGVVRMSASVRVFKDTCKGSLYIAEDVVGFESDDNARIFQTVDSDIQKIKSETRNRKPKN